MAVVALMGAVVLWSRAPWPAERSAWRHIALSGLLVHGVYLGGVFTAIGHGLPAGVTALVVGLQPLVTAALVLMAISFIFGVPSSFAITTLVR